MNDMELNLYLKYPFLYRVNKKKTEFRGIIEYGSGKSIFVIFYVPNYPSTKEITYSTRYHLETYEENLLQSESSKLNFFEFLELFKSLLCTRPNAELFNEKRFQLFCDELTSLRTLHPHQKFILDKEITHVKIIYEDDSCFTHNVKIRVDFHNISKPLYEVEECSFPEAKNELFPPEKSLKQLHKKFINYAEQLKLFYEMIGKIDAVCWVLDPLNPTSKHVSRRIVIEEGVSLQITFDPWTPTITPNMKFFGPSRLVNKFLDNLAGNISDWDADYDIIQNILRLLELPFFPIKTDEDVEDEKGECCVCYQHHLNNKLPDIICKNPNCESYFHAECLYQWLSTIPDQVIKFDTLVYGECPICEKKITIKISKALS